MTNTFPTPSAPSTTPTIPSRPVDESVRTATAIDDAATTRRRTAAVSRPEIARHTSALLSELDREWARMRRRPQVLREVRSWSSDPVLAPIVADVRDLDDLVGATQPHVIGVRDSDEVLRRLIARARDEELAGRIVLQRILPGLISRARRWDGHRRGPDACDVVIGAAWLAIRRYDVGVRSLHVAPSLIADALWIGLRRGSRRKVEQEIPVPGSVLMARPAPAHEATPIAALAGTLRAARRAGVPSADLDLMRHIVVAGSPSKAARQCKVSVRTIRNRRDTAAYKIRRALGPEWADWADPIVAA